MLSTRYFAIVFALTALSGCSFHTPRVMPGDVPRQEYLAPQDEQYGQEVLAQLVERYPLSRDDNAINRVRDIVDKLATAAKSDTTPWHVHILDDRSMRNAAATRGNYIFVWNGILETVPDDSELAVVLAHEMGHVLAGHTAPDPTEEVGQILGSVTGSVASGVLQGRGVAGPLADLAGGLTELLLNAALINPTQRDKELEADLVGMFLMADAGYDPNAALRFWQRAESDPNFGNLMPQFLSTHPSSSTRASRLAQFLPRAEERYKNRGVSQVAAGADTFRADTFKSDDTPSKKRVARAKSKPNSSKSVKTAEVKAAPDSMKAAECKIVGPEVAVVLSRNEKDAPSVEILQAGQEVKVIEEKEGFMHISSPLSGWVRSELLANCLK